MAAGSEPDLYGPWPKDPHDGWEPRAPSSEVLFQVVRDHLDDFLETVSLGDDGHGLPSFVEEELRAFVTCGDLRGGFARFKCRACGFERLLPFSCKGRGFCPSCMARRDAERAAHLVDRVIPLVPTRQLVLSLPVWLRYLLAWRHELCLEVLGIFADALGSFYQEQARGQGIADGRAGMVSVIQRYGGALNCNIHFHVTSLDGVFTQTADGDIAFHEAPVPKQKDIAVLCSVVRFRVLELLKAKGLLPNEADIDPFATDEPLLAAIVGASATSRIATGERAGQPVLAASALRDEELRRLNDRGSSFVHPAIAPSGATADTRAPRWLPATAKHWSFCSVTSFDLHCPRLGSPDSTTAWLAGPSLPSVQLDTSSHRSGHITFRHQGNP